MATTIINGYNVGTDVSFSIRDSYGDVFSASMLGHLTMFESASEDVDLKVTPITTGGIPVYQTLWNGNNGRMQFVRVGPAFQQLFMDLQQAYYSAGLISQMTIAASVRNRDGTIDEYLYSGVQFTKPTFGNFRATKEVDMAVGFKASTLKATGTLAAFLSNLSAA